MFKKLVTASTLLLTCMSTAWAGSFYLNPALKYQALRADKARYTGLVPILHFGYGDWVREWLMLSGDLFAGSSPIKIEDHPENGISVKPSYSYGFSLIPGVMLDETLTAYLRFGYIGAFFTSIDARKNGTQLGVGLEGKFTPCWSVNAEYIYTRYSALANGGVMRSDEASLGILYRFEGF